MKKLQQLLDEQLSKPDNQVDHLYINTLIKAIENKGMTIDMFVNTGRFKTRDTFVSESPNTILNGNCESVVTYVGNFFIQVLKGGWFYLDSDDKKMKRRNIATIEKYIWETHANAYLNVDK